MVLPGVRTDPRRPGGMPDAGSVNPGGPMPSVPQATRQPNMGAGVGEPDPKKIEEMFTQYTTGQITREDLFKFLHGESEGRGGILGLLESIGQQSEKPGSQPIGSPGSVPPQPQPQPAAVQNGQAISPGAASVPIPPLEEALDPRHQKISQLLQRYGLGPADADQLSTLLNTHIGGKKHLQGEDSGEGGDFGPSATETAATGDVGGRSDWEKRMGGTTSNKGRTTTDYAWDAPIDVRDIDATEEMRKEEVPQSRATPTRNPNLDWDTPVDARDIDATTTMQEEEVSALPISQAREAELAYLQPGRGISGIHEVDTGQDLGARKRDTWYEDEAARMQLEAEQLRLRLLEEEKYRQMQDEETRQKEITAENTFDFHPFAGGSFDKRSQWATQDEEGNWWPSHKALREFKAWVEEQGEYWDGSKVGFGEMVGGKPQPEEYFMAAYKGKQYKFKRKGEMDMFLEFGIFPDRTYLPGFGPGKPPPTGPPGAPKKRTVFQNPDGSTTTTEPDGTVIEKDKDGNIISTTAGGIDVDDEGGDGLPVAVDTPSTGAMTPTELRKLRLEAPLLAEFVSKLTEEMVTTTDNKELAQSMIEALSELDALKIKGDEAARERMSGVVVNALDREAVTKRADADRAFQEGAAIGEIDNKVTLAARAEQNKQAFSLSQQSGYLPVWNENTKQWRIPTAAEIEGGQAVGGVEREALRITEDDKNRQYSMDLTTLFGTYVNPEGDPTKSMETLAMQTFGLTKALQIAETTGKIPTDWSGSSSFTDVDTFAMKRFTFEQDMSNRNADVQDRMASNAEQTQQTNLAIANNRNTTERAIAAGNLSEAVESRKAQTQLANQQLDLERDRMKLDTLMSLANPASFLFAQRFGLLDDIGAALGIDWGEDIMELPRMLPDNYIPSLTEFQDATPMQREIMLSEMASAGGYTSDEAIRRIIEGAPGGRQVQRAPLMARTR